MNSMEMTMASSPISVPVSRRHRSRSSVKGSRGLLTAVCRSPARSPRATASMSASSFPSSSHSMASHAKGSSHPSQSMRGPSKPRTTETWSGPATIAARRCHLFPSRSSPGCHGVG
ncbi:Hypothetical protein A7982_04433 [Minicystis rosea]|nr:Hypothetical protein A7982_04433 [Minicystis rosea]